MEKVRTRGWRAGLSPTVRVLGLNGIGKATCNARLAVAVARLRYSNTVFHPQVKMIGIGIGPGVNTSSSFIFELVAFLPKLQELNSFGFYGMQDSQMMNMPTDEKNGCSYKKPHIVVITSRVNNLRFHCKSKDDDLGEVTRNAGEAYSINFCVNMWSSTLYFCHFYLESKQRMFDVYATVKKHDPDYCYTGQYFGKVECNWLVKEDGFYIAKYPNPGQSGSLEWVKRFDWE
ncbi:hypothetical protein QVD17_20874 [Tagetes erecta]|uniref:S-protein homolog n=1 Tax=Tagetes erecta TaxID=13708 RepID=A0AAD8NYL7_TARER|nr:hypothetical protein QVD17_20874 [Tagetes erecta]